LNVLLNASRRRDVLTLTQQKKPEADPARQIAAWLRHLSTVTAKLQIEGTPWQPNLLGLPAFDDEVERACVATLNGQTSDFSEGAAAALRQLRALPATACLFDA
jgi:hypothetical protein